MTNSILPASSPNLFGVSNRLGQYLTYTSVCWAKLEVDIQQLLICNDKDSLNFHAQLMLYVVFRRGPPRNGDLDGNAAVVGPSCHWAGGSELS